MLALHVPPEVEGVVEGDLSTDRASVAFVEAVPADPLLEAGGGVDVHDVLLIGEANLFLEFCSDHVWISNLSSEEVHKHK